MRIPLMLVACVAPIVTSAQPQGNAWTNLGLFSDTVLRNPEIVVAEIKTLDAPLQGQFTAGPLRAHVRVTQILRDARGLGLEPRELDLQIRLSVPGGRMNCAWNSHILAAGRTYILYSERELDLESIVAGPSVAEPVPEGFEAIGDVELALKLPGLPLSEQANAVASALADGRPHTSIAGHAAVLLGAGSDADTAPLRSVLDGVGALAFSNVAKSAFLSALRQMKYKVREPSDNLVHVYANLVVRYFLLDAHEGKQGPLGVQESLLQTDLPEIRKSPREIAALRLVSLSQQDREVLQREVLRRQSDPRLTPQVQAEAAELLKLFPAQ